MKTKERIQEINKLQEELSQELKSLQEKCTHVEYHIGTYSWRVGSYDQKRICEECGSILDSPSDDELKDFNDEICEKFKNQIGFKSEEGRNFIKPSWMIGQGTKIYQR